MAKDNGTKRVTRKRSTAPKTVRKPRLADEAVAELQGPRVEETTQAAEITHVEEAAPLPIEVVDAPPEAPVAAPVAAAEVVAEEISVVEAAPPPRAVSVWPAPSAEPRMEAVRPDRRFRRVAFVRAMLHRLRHEAEKRGAPIVRRVVARFPRLAALHDTIRRWL